MNRESEREKEKRETRLRERERERVEPSAPGESSESTESTESIESSEFTESTFEDKTCPNKSVSISSILWTDLISRIQANQATPVQSPQQYRPTTSQELLRPHSLDSVASTRVHSATPARVRSSQ